MPRLGASFYRELAVERDMSVTCSRTSCSNLDGVSAQEKIPGNGERLNNKDGGIIGYVRDTH